jgi:hypothetical protein
VDRHVTDGPLVAPLWATAKPVLDEIDRVLASHYGFTDEALEFVINYDLKYRMGDEAEEGGGGS